MAKSTFEKNGGYFIDGVAYMDCKVTGEPVPNVSTDSVSVIGSRAVMGMVGIPEEPKVEEVSEDVHQQPEAEFRFPILYHDRKNLSIQRQQSIKFALELLQIKLTDLHDESGVPAPIGNLGCDEVQDFIWNGIQELWKDIPREVDNSEK